MTAPRIDRILAEAAPGEIRAVAFAGEAAWDIAFERPGGDAGEGDIYWARAGAPGPGGGRFFDLGGGRVGFARRPRRQWSDGAYGLVQIARASAGDKGARVTDRVELAEGSVAAWLHASGPVADRLEIARGVPKAAREALRAAVGAKLPADVGARILLGEPDRVVATLLDLLARLRAMEAGSGPPKRAFVAGGEVTRSIRRWPEAIWAPADPATAAWLVAAGLPPALLSAPDDGVCREIDSEIAAARLSAVDLPGGARLWIEPTRALVAIDVDSGASAAAAPAINAAAGREIARQFRLRRLGGLIAIDFLKEGMAEGHAALRSFAADDPWPWTPPASADPSGLTALQRARLGPSLLDMTEGDVAAGLAALRLAIRVSRRGRAPARLEARAGVIGQLRGQLREAHRAAVARLGAPLDLTIVEGLRFARILGQHGEILEEAT